VQERNNMVFTGSYWLPKKLAFNSTGNPGAVFIGHSGTRIDIFSMNRKSGWDESIAKKLVQLWNTEYKTHSITWPRIGQKVLYLGRTLGLVADIDRKTGTTKDMALVDFYGHFQWVDTILLEEAE